MGDLPIILPSNLPLVSNPTAHMLYIQARQWHDSPITVWERRLHTYATLTATQPLESQCTHSVYPHPMYSLIILFVFSFVTHRLKIQFYIMIASSDY